MGLAENQWELIENWTTNPSRIGCKRIEMKLCEDGTWFLTCILEEETEEEQDALKKLLESQGLKSSDDDETLNLFEGGRDEE